MTAPIKNQASSYQEKFNQFSNKKYLTKGVFIFIIITLITFTLLFLYHNVNDIFTIIRGLNLIYIFLACLLLLLDWWLGGFRNHLFIRETNKNIKQRICIKANLANIFLGTVTPSQTGGGPANLYMLWRGGVKFTDGIAMSVINYISTIFFFIISSGVSIYYLDSLISNKLLNLFIYSSLIIFTTGFCIVCFSIFLPYQTNNLITIIGNQLYKIPYKRFKNIKLNIKQIKAKIYDYHKTIIFFFKKKLYLIFFSLIVTFILYFNKYVLAFVLLLGLGIDVNFWIIIAVQSIIFLIIYHAPSPGGSGIAELSIASLMNSVIANGDLAMFTLLHRTFLSFLSSIFGGFILIKEIKDHSNEKIQKDV